MKTLVAAVAALALAAVPAHAADLLLDPPAVEYTGAFQDWSGFYAGVMGGYGAGPGTSTSTATGTATITQLSGGLVGAAAGYNYQMDNLVLGAEGELLWSGIQGSRLCANPAFGCSGNIGWLTSVRARAGVALDTLLLYGNLGVAAAGFTANTTPAVGGTTGTFSGVALGWTAGVGAEVAVSENTSVKAEYAYYDLGTQAPANTVDGPAINLRAQVHAVKLGLNFSF